MIPRDQIIYNLEKRVHPVSAVIAVNGIDDIQQGMVELKSLVEEGIIKLIVINKLAFYQYNRF